MRTLWQDLRYAARMLVKNPGFTAVGVMTLALGIGANSAIFSVVNAVLLRPLAYHDPGQLVFINHNYPKLDLNASVSAPGYAHYRDHARSFSGIAALRGWSVNLTGSGGEPERLRGMETTANFFPLLGAEAARGRVFTAEAEQVGRHRIVVISDALWHRRFGADPGTVNRTITLNGESYDIVGVMPPSFQFGREVGQIIDVWAPLAFTPEQLSINNLTNENLSVLARLKTGVNFAQAQAEMDTVAADVRRQYMPNSDSSNWGLILTSFNELVVGDIRPALWVLLSAVGFVLLIACANVANLLLARASARGREIAVRTALGAGRWRVVRQLLTESLLMAFLGGLLGLLLATWGVELLVSIDESKIPRAGEIGLDFGVVAFTFGVTLLTGMLFGLAPALQSSKVSLHDTLKEGGRSGSAGERQGLRKLLVMSEMALAVVLLIGAGLLVKSFLRLQHVDPGFDPDRVLAMQLSLPNFKYPEPQQRDFFHRRVLEQVRALPGVRTAGAISVLPMSGTGSSGSFRIEGRDVPSGETMPHGDRWLTTPDYFGAMNVRLLEGRFFTERDAPEAPGVAIIDETLARKYWPGEDPLGKRISFESDGQNNRRWREIVGIVGHVRQKALEGESRGQYYVPYSQRPVSPDMFLVVKTATDPSSLAGPVRGVIRNLDEDLPVFRVTTMEQLVADSLAQRRFAMLLSGVFAAIALVLAAVGLYGVMSYTVTQRTRELGVRISLGAQRGDVLKLVVGQGAQLIAAGLACGLVAAFLLTRLMSTLLYGVTATDPLTFVGVSLALAAVALVACYVPARRATRVDPLVALRHE